MNKKYQVELIAHFLTNAPNPDVIREKLKKVIMQHGFEEKAFEITITGLSGKGEFVSPQEAKPELPVKKSRFKTQAMPPLAEPKKKRGRPPKAKSKGVKRK
jgi:hypothetical protein